VGFVDFNVQSLRDFPPQALTFLTYQSEIKNHQSKIINPKSKIQNHQSKIQNHQSKIVNHQSKIANHFITLSCIYIDVEKIIWKNGVNVHTFAASK
jgi:hypothetical protein